MRFSRLPFAGILLISSLALAALSKDDLVFVGQDIGDSTDSSIITYYEKNDHNGEGRNFGFADTHVEFVKTADIPKVVKECNAARSKIGLGPIHVPGDGSAPPSQP
jgi:prepilin-type processing-associated H-X9-DG protein